MTRKVSPAPPQVKRRAHVPENVTRPPHRSRERDLARSMTWDIAALVTRQRANYGRPQRRQDDVDMIMTTPAHRRSGLSEESERIDRIVLPALRDAMAAVPAVERIVLFGSRARGDDDARSDIDIAISCPAAGKRTWLDICRVAEEAETLLEIDLVRLEEAAPEFRQRIESEGKVLYERRQS